ncbi:MAG: ABC transporter substrate-binding protein [Chloroflexi bacterium]|nr:ABC transporter substrate-binding protein [Chloroflexota bacterium]
MHILKRTKSNVHPYVPELQDLYQQGRVSRREFLRLATLLGVSLAGAEALIGVAPAAASARARQAVVRGGTMTIATRVQRVDHPARFSWIEAANQFRQVCEYLVRTDWDNITEPWLLEKWEANETVDEWTLFLRAGIKFNDGTDLTADDVIFNFEQWLDPDIGSSMLGLMSYLKPENIEKVDDLTVKLHLDTPQIGVPEHLFHYPALIVPKTFEGDLVRQPVGTGPFMLEDYVETERATFVRREDHWRMGEDGSPLPYLDRLVFVDLGEDTAAQIAALQGGQVDNIYNPSIDVWQAVKEMPGVAVYSANTAQTFHIRMRVDQPPFDNVKVRQALKKCIDRQKMLDLAWFGEGVLGHDSVFAPVHPEYCEKEIPAYDPEGAKALLAEAGYPDGLEVELSTQQARAEPAMAQSLQETAAAGGFNIKLNILPSAQYWDIWTEVPLGITIWAHRPLGIMIPALAFTADENGVPGAWNETRWVDEEYVTLLRQAESTLDVEKRREIACMMEDIEAERGSCAIPFFTSVWYVCHERFKGVRAHPTNYDLFDEVWEEKA